MEIIFSFADEIHGTMPHGRSVEQVPNRFIQGIHTHVVQSRYVGTHHLFGVRLHPNRVQQLLGILPSELNNLAVDLTLVQPRFNQLRNQLGEAASFEERVQILQQELPVLAAATCQRSEELSRLFIAAGTDSFQTVDELAKQVCYSPRQLNRVVHQLFGLSAEELTGYKKFVESVKLIHTNNSSLTSIAYHTGFYDQSHFCRVFKSYTGLTPNQYKQRKSHLPFHLFS